MPNYPITVADGNSGMQNGRHRDPVPAVSSTAYVREPSNYSATSRRLRVRCGSTGMPGPVVVVIVTFLM